jgi:hypothetical protein
MPTYSVNIVKEMPTGLRTKSIFVAVQDDDTGEARLVELPGVWIDEDAQTHVEALRKRDLWQAGEPTDREVFDLADEGSGTRKYYKFILRAIERAQIAGGTLDTAVAAGLDAIARNNKRKAQFDGRRAWMGLTQPGTVEEKRALLLAMEVFALRGLQNINEKERGDAPVG